MPEGSVRRLQSGRRETVGVTTREEALAPRGGVFPLLLLSRRTSTAEWMNPAGGFVWALLLSAVLWLALGVLVAAYV